MLEDHQNGEGAKRGRDFGAFGAFVCPLLAMRRGSEEGLQPVFLCLKPQREHLAAEDSRETSHPAGSQAALRRHGYRGGPRGKPPRVGNRRICVM